METYESGTELADEIRQHGKAFISEFQNIPEQYWDELQPEADNRTPRQMLAYELGWMSLLLDWEHNEQEGHLVHTPADGYSWLHLSNLYEMFDETWQDSTPQQMIDSFNNLISQIQWMINEFSQDELFGKNQRKWAESTPAAGPLWQWISLHTVDSFVIFGDKIRRWKQAMAQHGMPA
ncbi:ClbS/DfsB family four-helix bundle protein [Bifidobacterium canis]|uniref:Cytoplasmic protein n=1 Tax=Bifidobacterium canis TaxID=2610880 RepID=A0A7K1J722_9BIFI|nr:ClbS/DfsB family four-helix bundle protein [Bifidobacterium canis]MUH60468.1 cytoplasmic protein [Bifidobacterium canis]